MHGNSFIHDMAIIMLVAGIVTLLFNKWKQPVVLGYLAAGIIIGPHMPSILAVHDKTTITTLGELGVVFLMFSLGLEFSLKKIAKVGASAFITAICETSLMIAIGYNLGRYFGWQQMDCMFLGAMMAISSTTIIVKALGELGLKQHKFAQLIFGVLIVEDILAIGIIALLSGIATSGKIVGNNIVTTLGQLSLFIIVTLVIGLLTIPRLLGYIAKFKSNEMMLISTLGLCFGLCLAVITLNYSLALGAFMMGAIIAEAKPLHQIEKLIEPLKDMFCAIFFVTIGMMFDPNILMTNLSTILIISVALILGKMIGATSGAFLSGESGRNSLKVGMGLTQIGEFSFIIASLGTTLGVTNPQLYPLAIAVSAITTLSTPYMINLASPISNVFTHHARPLVKAFNHYTVWIHELHPSGDSAMIVKFIFKIIAQIIVNSMLVAAVFIASAFCASNLDSILFGKDLITLDDNYHRSIVCGFALLVSLPFTIASYRKLKALSMIFSELWIRNRLFGKHTYRARQVIFETVPVITIIWIMSLIFSISHQILPEPKLLLTLEVGAFIIAIIFWKQFIKIQSWLQIQLFSVMEEHEKPAE